MSAIELKVAAGNEGWGDCDGLYTLFNFQVGNETQRQNFRFVPSTSGYATFIMRNGTCNFDEGTLNGYALLPRDPEVCSAESGIGTYQGQQSLGWDGQLSDSYDLLGITPVLLGFSLEPTDIFGARYAPAVEVGTDVVSIQLANNSWYQAGNASAIYADATLTYILPTFGLGFGEWTSDLGHALSFMDSIASSFSIPSRSWGYTAGAHYWPPNVGTHGSLVLGGYDNARRNDQRTATFNIPEDTQELLVDVASINVAWREGPPISYPTSFKAVIDSTLPYLMLPESLCTWFAEQYNLTLDEGTGLYFVSSTNASANSDRTASISFLLQDAVDKDAQTTINFPYRAFNASLHWSWANQDPQIIFPMKRMNETAVLGRAFLQEAYIFANYEPDKMEFHVSQTVFDNRAPEIVPVYRTTDVPPKTSLSTGAIAGIAVGGGVLLILIAVAIWWYISHKKKKREREAEIRKEKERQTGEPFPALKPPEVEMRRDTISSNWSENTFGGASEVDATSPSSAVRRPGPSRGVSELSSDSEHQAGYRHMATVHELQDKSDAGQLEALGERARRRDQSLGELEGSSNWDSVDPPRSPEPTSPSIYRPPTPPPGSSPMFFNPYGPPSPPEGAR